MIARDLKSPPREGSLATIAHLELDNRSSSRIRIVDAALAEISEVGVTRMTMEAVAARAKLSRATLYRSFPGGKDPILLAVAETELARFWAQLARSLSAADQLREALVVAISETTSYIQSHEAFQRVLSLEPELISAHLEFQSMDEILLTASAITAPFFARWLSSTDSLRAAEWATRIVVSYLLTPSASLDLSKPEDATYLVDRFMIPGVLALKDDVHQAPQSSKTTKQLALGGK